MWRTLSFFGQYESVMEIPSSSFNFFFSMELFKAHSHMSFSLFILTHMLLICHDFRLTPYIESSSFAYVCLCLDRFYDDKKLYYNICGHFNDVLRPYVYALCEINWYNHMCRLPAYTQIDTSLISIFVSTNPQKYTFNKTSIIQCQFSHKDAKNYFFTCNFLSHHHY